MPNIAYIAYVPDQNEPSKPHIAQVRHGSVAEDLKELYLSIFREDENGNELNKADLRLFRGDHWGDVVVSNAAEEAGFVFVTFEDKSNMNGLELLQSSFTT